MTFILLCLLLSIPLVGVLFIYLSTSVIGARAVTAFAFFLFLILTGVCAYLLFFNPTLAYKAGLIEAEISGKQNIICLKTIFESIEFGRTVKDTFASMLQFSKFSQSSLLLFIIALVYFFTTITELFLKDFRHGNDTIENDIDCSFFALLLLSSLCSIGIIIFNSKLLILLLYIATIFINFTFIKLYGGRFCKKVALGYILTNALMVALAIFCHFAFTNQEAFLTILVLMSIFSAFQLYTSLASHIVISTLPLAGLVVVIKILLLLKYIVISSNSLSLVVFICCLLSIFFSILGSLFRNSQNSIGSLFSSSCCLTMVALSVTDTAGAQPIIYMLVTSAISFSGLIFCLTSMESTFLSKNLEDYRLTIRRNPIYKLLVPFLILTVVFAPTSFGFYGIFKVFNVLSLAPSIAFGLAYLVSLISSIIILLRVFFGYTPKDTEVLSTVKTVNIRVKIILVFICLICLCTLVLPFISSIGK